MRLLPFLDLRFRVAETAGWIKSQFWVRRGWSVRWREGARPPTLFAVLKLGARVRRNFLVPRKSDFWFDACTFAKEVFAGMRRKRALAKATIAGF